MQFKKYIQQQLDGKNLFISGGTGFFGKNILKYLQSNAIELNRVTVLTRDAQKFKSNYPELLNCSYLDFLEQDITKLSATGDKYDYVIHAATSVVEKVDSLRLVNEIIQGTRNILEFAAEAKACSVVNISSGAVYG